jgi:FAD/FMN-containing dehydrogenase/Fe-S oxidoreductase
VERLGVVPLDPVALERALRSRVDGEVRFDEGSRALYATDGSNYRQVPIGVVVPRSIDALVEAVRVCYEFGAPILPRGCGTSLGGQSCGVAVILDISKHLRRIEKIDPERRIAVVEPGVVLDQLRDEAKKHGLTFAPDPSTHVSNTLGGMLGNNSCGVHSVMGGRTSDNVEALEVLTYDGLRMTVGPTSEDEYRAILAEGGRRADIYRGMKRIADEWADEIRRRFPNIPRRISGYNFPDLLPEGGFHVARALVGTEATCVVILRATVRLVPNPPKRAILVLGYPDIYRAADDVPRVMEQRPIGLEAIDEHLVRNMKAFHQHAKEADMLPDGAGWLMAEFGGATQEEADGQARRAVGALGRDERKGDTKVVSDPNAQRQLWLVRESGLSVTAREPDGTYAWEGWEDSAVPPEKLGTYLRQLRSLLDRYGYDTAMYGHFGQGCLHARINFDLFTPEGVRTFSNFLDDASRLVVSLGGSLSGEHGDGQSKARMLTIMYGPELVNEFRAFKRLWDPWGKMNPGKIVDAFDPTQNLRVYETYRPRPYRAEFAYPEDSGDWNRVTLRCVGIGKCRKTDSGVMCPSYMGTLDEEKLTRGRARLLYEMAQNGALSQGWKNPHVREALDWCLSCKACKTECPVRVDMATYKAEFLNRYYEGRFRPRTAYSLGLSYRWLPVGARIPRFINALSSWSPTADLLKSLGGIARARSIPKIATRPFHRAFRARQPERLAPSRRVAVLWPDTWNNYLHPHILESAASVLGKVGYAVALPERIVCCGRPLYDYGMLGRARRQLRASLDALGPALEAGHPVVVLEPSCLSVFKDELPNLMPGDPRAKQLAAQAVSIAELVDRAGVPLARTDARTLVQPHCHQASVLGTDALKSVFGKISAAPELLDAGCCGMAGSFGMEREKYEVSVKIAERRLLPAVRGSRDSATIVADGFSCREQLSDLLGLEALHSAQAIDRALGGPPGGSG